MVYRFPYIRITNPSLPDIAKYQFHPLIKVGLLNKPFGFSAVLGVYGFLDHFTFKANIPEGYFEIEPIWE